MHNHNIKRFISSTCLGVIIFKLLRYIYIDFRFNLAILTYFLKAFYNCQL